MCCLATVSACCVFMSPDNSFQVYLPALLGVDLLHCERQAGEAVAASGGELQLLQGELVTVSYFDTLAAEVADSLQVLRPLQAHVSYAHMS